MTISGDCFWLNRFVVLSPNDTSSLSLAPIWLPNPEESEVEKLLTHYDIEKRKKIKEVTSQKQIDLKTGITGKQLRDKQILEDFRKIDAILPQTESESGRRTDLLDQVTEIIIRRHVPDKCLIYLESVAKIVPCFTHLKTRVVEKDVRAIGNLLLEKVCICIYIRLLK